MLQAKCYGWLWNQRYHTWLSHWKIIFKSQLCLFIEMVSLKTFILCTTETHDGYGFRFHEIYGPWSQCCMHPLENKHNVFKEKYTYHVDKISGESVTTVIGQVLAVNECMISLLSESCWTQQAHNIQVAYLQSKHLFFIVIIQ